MTIHGFQKLTLLDYPGRVACTVFTGGCNFRCPFCQNAGLVLSPDKEPVIEEEEVLAVLKKTAKHSGGSLCNWRRAHFTERSFGFPGESKGTWIQR